jgi:hypothetical protein
MRLRARGLLVLVLLLTAGCRKPLKFTEFSPPDGAFTVLMPGAPEKKTQNIRGVQGTVWGVDVPGGAFTVVYFDLPPGVPFDLDAGIRGVAGQFDGTVVSSQNYTFEGTTGREFEIESKKPKGHVCGRAFVVGSRAYQVAAMGDHYRLTSPDVQKFLDSFKLNSKPGAGIELRQERQNDPNAGRPPRQDGGQPPMNDPRVGQPQPGQGQANMDDWVAQANGGGGWAEVPMAGMRPVQRNGAVEITNVTGIGGHAGIATRKRFDGDLTIRLEVHNAKAVGLKSAVGDGAWAGVDLPANVWHTVVVTRRQGQVSVTVNGQPTPLIDINSRGLGQAIFYVHVSANQTAVIRNIDMMPR